LGSLTSFQRGFEISSRNCRYCDNPFNLMI
jgi:hypothetical protein